MAFDAKKLFDNSEPIESDENYTLGDILSVTAEEVLDNIDSSFPYVTQLPKTIGEPRLTRDAEVGVADFVPPGGWMKWERNIYMMGRPHQTLHQIANHAINFELHPAVELPPPKPKEPEPPAGAPTPQSEAHPTQQPPKSPFGQKQDTQPAEPKAPAQPTPAATENLWEKWDNSIQDYDLAEEFPEAGPGDRPNSFTPAPDEDIDPELVKRATLAALDCHYLEDICDQFNLEQALKIATVYRDAFGYGAIYPVYDRIPDPNHPLGFYLGNLKKLRVLDSTQLQIIRDNVFDLRQLYTFFPNIPPKLEAMGKPAKPNNTGRIVGFILTISSDTRTKLIDATGQEIKPDVWARLMPGMDEMSIDYTRVFYYDDELIVFFRDASNMFPDGVSLLRANYTLLENKLTLDRVAVTGYAKSVIPTWLVRLPAGMRQFTSQIHHELQRARNNPGADIVLMNKEGLDINRTIADQLAEAVPLLSYTEDQYNAGFGIFDTMSNSASANRATAEIQSDLFMRTISPLRKDVENVITTRLFMPLLEKKHGLTPSMIMQAPASMIAGVPDDPQQVPRQDVIPTGDKPYLLPKWKWGALIDSDKNALLAAFGPFLNAMSQDQIDFVLENFGGIPKRLGEPSGILAKQEILDKLRLNWNVGAPTSPQTSEGNITPQQQPTSRYGKRKAGVKNPNPPDTAGTSYQSTGVGKQTREGGSATGRDARMTSDEGPVEDLSLDVRTVDEQRKEKGLPPLPDGLGNVVVLPNGTIL